MVQCRLRVHVAWWLKFYIGSVALACYLTGRTPDMNKVQWWIERGVSLRIDHRPASMRV